MLLPHVHLMAVFGSCRERKKSDLTPTLTI